jgi:hypothetical protein
MRLSSFFRDRQELFGGVNKSQDAINALGLLLSFIGDASDEEEKNNLTTLVLEEFAKSLVKLSGQTEFTLHDDQKKAIAELVPLARKTSEYLFSATQRLRSSSLSKSGRYEKISFFETFKNVVKIIVELVKGSFGAKSLATKIVDSLDKLEEATFMQQLKDSRKEKKLGSFVSSQVKHLAKKMKRVFKRETLIQKAGAKAEAFKSRLKEVPKARS